MRSRGWPGHARVEVDFLDVADDMLPENAGRWTLHVADGRAEMTRGGSGAVRVDVRVVGALYTAWLDPWTLAATGEIEAPDAEKAKLAAAFTGASPWMSDFF